MKDKFEMKFSLATNFDKRLIPEIAEIDSNKAIKSVYGKMKSDVIGGGRAAMFLPDFSMDYLKEYIKLCHDNGIEFNYLLNAMCLSNKDLQKDTREEIMKFVGELSDAGIDWLTLNSPNLCKIVKRDFPKIKISVGVHACVSELQHIKTWEDIGIDEITLQIYMSRNFEILERMLKYTKDSGIALRVFANVFCLHQCSYRISHSSGQAHASRTNEPTEKFYLDNYTMSCTYDKVKNPVNMITSDWIRPEDVKYYEELCEKTGNYNFSIKLVERTKSTDFLMRVAKAYLSRSYDGNLLDLMLWSSPKSPLGIFDRNSSAAKPIDPKQLERFKVFQEFYSIPEIYIDNKKLDGFIDKFITNYDCNKKVCAGTRMKNRTLSDESVKCSYCKQWVNKAMKYNTEEVNTWLNRADGILTSISDGSLLS